MRSDAEGYQDSVTVLLPLKGFPLSVTSESVEESKETRGGIVPCASHGWEKRRGNLPIRGYALGG